MPLHERPRDGHSLIDRSNLLTEQRLERSKHLDQMSISDALELMNSEDAAAVAAVAAERHNVVRAVEIVSGALAKGGRLFYVGAGTSGRLGVLDASECPPTFGVDPGLVQGIIAGGEAAMFRSQEGAEDKPEDGAAAIDGRGVGAADVVMGIAAGGTTPFVRGTLIRAKELRASTIFLCCVKPGAEEPPADVVIRPLTGPEVLTGSTRLKAGTATKLVLNQITTLAMVQLGKVYENLMVDLRVTNAKLRDRAARIVSELTGLHRAEARELLESAGNDVKVATVMNRQKVNADEARHLLDQAEGRLRVVLGQWHE
jgi:N-acetylmuramic acid 6-phosphate etherase